MSVADKERKIRRRNRLYHSQDGKCHYCDCRMIHWNDFRCDPQKLAKVLPRNLATLEHLRDRFHPERSVPPRNQEQRWVIACRECNGQRGKEVQAMQPIEVLRERSKRQRASQKTSDDRSTFQSGSVIQPGDEEAYQ